ncbi:amino acid adenylation domain-containing protein [Cronbergia sp. UHCC 0137]|uniref:non-ribosomal peptide synthetase n=1 Tax=Cronbergia sp. UHCC 0137 TaxID=3110239 RepID=UPI002B21B13F|nr:non-ribosomal peptide synthetase [Cronbergia sp. UHCC 0137]MEA5616273.1 amino acid adenylation domain-containing protein [Cronbergia sp. UHCC 0137]
MMNYSQTDDIDLLELLLEEEGIELGTDDALISRRGLTQAPASFQQRRLWFLYELEPTSSAYNICSVFSVQGFLNVPALQQAFQQLQRKHESLRSTFVDIDGEPWQKIHPDALTELVLEDWSGNTNTVDTIARSEGEHTFNLQTGPLIRARLFRFAAEQHILTLTLHHIIADAWSMGVILQEIAIFYKLAITEEKIVLPELTFQYSDYALWQQEKFSNSHLGNSLNYWEKKLAELPTLQFPLDFSRPKLQTFRGDLVKFELSKNLTTAIRTLSQKQGATLFMTLMAAFQALLARYTGQEDIPVGTSIANRPGMDAEQLIGFFVNMLVIRTNLADEPSFITLLDRVKTTVLDAFEHTEVPFETLVEKLNLERDTSRNPLFQIAFTLLNAPKPEFSTGDLEVSILATQEAARFDLELFITESEDHLNGVFSYNVDLLKRETVERFARHFCQLLENLITQPDIPVSRVPFLLTEELAILAPSQPAQSFSVQFCLHEIFTQQAKLRPQQTALIFAQERLSYSEVNYRANQLAHYLINAGVNPETRVGLWLSRSLDLVIAILGILKAGGVYVPFDTNYPSDRIAYMLEDSQVTVLLTHTQFQTQIPPHTAKTIFIDHCQTEITQAPTTEPEILVLPDNAAYIIYTSGSTGKPKGVVVTHRHVTRLMLATEKWFKFNPKDVWTLFHSCAFDFSVWEIWGALFYGGRLVIVPYLVSRSPEEFYNLLCEEKITVLNQTPSAFRQLIQAESILCREGELELRYVIFGGEALDLASLEPWFERHDDQFPLLVNMYGITETTVHVTYRPLSLKDVKKRLGSLIGKPIPDLSLYILDRHCQPVPIGVVGEMYVGGAGVTRGYFHRPQLTAERMIPNPFNTSKPERLYKTGDLARFLDNGEIEYIGRNDHQVKVRGFRIELGEIEAVIKRHPGVTDALVLVREESKEDIRIEAYIVPKNQILDSEILIKEQTQEWQYTFNDTYNLTESETNEDFNITGWNSSYDNQPIPAEEMRQWLNNTLSRVQALKPQRVLEIGCGTGMILLNIAPQIESYWGTDFSQAAITRLTNIIQNRSLNNVNLLTREAIDFSEIPENYFDTIVINSVAQYFPSIEYLQQVITGALQILAPGGSLFLGDNRNLSLLNYFHASVAYFQADESTDKETFKNQVQRIAKTENELVIDPQFFISLIAKIPDLTAVEVHLKAENSDNELTKYRYDAILHKLGQSENQPIEINWQDWETANLQLTDLKQQIVKTGTIGWCNIANARLIKDTTIWQWMSESNSKNTTEELSKVINKIKFEKAINPADLYAIAQEIGCQVTISYSPENPDYFDVCFYPSTAEKPLSPLMPISSKIPTENNNSYWLDPLKSRFTKSLISQLKEQVREKLPEYMCPSGFVMLEKFPMTPSGKLDRRALPIPEREITISKQAFVQATTPTEKKLSQLWTNVLGIDKIGVTDDFFHLGGHSLLATKLVSRIREEFNIALPLRAVFEYSTISGLGTEIDRLAGVNNSQNTQQDIITAIPNRENLPLSFSQSRLWFLDLLEPNNAAYNISVAFRLDGNLNLEGLHQSLQTIIQRHEVLRTTFENIDGVPIQVIHEFLEVPLTVINLSHLDSQTQQETLRTTVQEAIITPFNLRQLPLLRVHLYQLSEEVNVLVLVIHHIISDGWSLGLMIQELSLYYTAICEDKIRSLPTLSIQYADFANWQRTVFAQTQLPAQLAYWRQKLAGANEILQLPTDYPRPAVASYQGSAISFTINKQIGSEFQKLCESQGATLFMGLLGVFSILLMRYSSQEDFLIGTPIANRNRKQIEDLIGFFVNTLVIRNNLTGNPTFITLLSRIKEETLQAYAHQDVPFERIVEEIHPERNLSNHPLFQVMFVLQNNPMGKLELPDLQLTPWEVEQALAKFDLTLLMTETEKGIEGIWEYRTDLFTVETIKRMIGHFQTLLDNIIAQPQQPIHELSILTASEQDQLLVQWNHTQIKYSQNKQNKSIHQLFELQVEKTPDAVAVVFQNENLTYQELNQRANQLAHYLQSLGVKPDVLVGICIERSLEMVVGLLGILKAGGAYVPLDPNYPQERLTFMLEDAQISILLTQKQLRESLDIPSVSKIVCLDSDWEIIAQKNTENSFSNVVGNNLAYLIYTSGSTGKPKGVMIPHHAICNHMLWMQETFALQETDKVLQKTSFSFDASVWEFYAPLLTGGQLIVAEKGRHQDSPYLLKLISEQQVTVLQLVPSLLQMLLEQGGIENCKSLKHIFCGGEALSVELEQSLLSKLNVNLHNLYGPTEACIDTTFWTCRNENNQQSKQKIVPIGHPIANTQTYILDSLLQPVPIGIPGELYIGGMGLAWGYLQRPELTAEKFIPHLFSNQPGARLYKTGDLVRYLADGNIEFLGRIDHQVKIRGFRIELGEVEAALYQHPHVLNAVVITSIDSSGGNSLIAYIVTQEKPLISSGILRDFLKAKLPDYMIPSAFVILDHLPLTPNGKVDRKALSVLNINRNIDVERHILPRTPLEYQLVEIWEEILKVSPIGVTENFFDLGGHSLLGIRLIAAIEQKLKCNLPVVALFREGTIEKIAALLDQAKPSSNLDILIPLQPQGNLPPLFLIHQAGGYGLSYSVLAEELAKQLDKQRPIYAIQAQGLDGKQRPLETIEAMANSYINAIQEIQPCGPYLLGGHSLGGLIAFAMTNQLEAIGEKVEHLLIIDTHPPLALDEITASLEDNAGILCFIVEQIGLHFNKTVSITYQELASLDQKSQFDYVLQILQHHEVIPPDSGRDLIAGLISVYKANIQASLVYQPQPIKSPITLFKTASLAAQFPDDPTLGWGHLSSEKVRVCCVTGEHQTMLKEPHIKSLVMEIIEQI